MKKIYHEPTRTNAKNSKQIFVFSIIILFALSSGLSAQELSGVFDSTVNYTAGAGDAPDHSFGIEEYANLRLRVKTGERANFYAAFNLIAQAGNYLDAGLLGTLYLSPHYGYALQVYSQNYIAALELERLYFRINGDYFDTEAGLLRMNFGYGQVWGSSDFLNSRNPLLPNARPRGVLGTNVSFYPTDSLKLMVFAAAPRDPLESEGGAIIPGFSLDQHWARASVQGLYAFETPLADSERGIHRFGLSLKADLELGFVLDALYTYNPAMQASIDGLSAGAGFDYNFFGGDLYLLFEYLFNGPASSTAFRTNNLMGRMNYNYLYGSVLYRFNNFTSLSLSALFCFNDLSFQPIAAFDYEFFQGFSMNVTVRLPLDQKVFSGGKAGELGPIPPGFDLNGNPINSGARAIVNAGVRLKF